MLLDARPQRVAAKVVELQAARDVAKVKLAGPQAKALLPDLSEG